VHCFIVTLLYGDPEDTEGIAAPKCRRSINFVVEGWTPRIRYFDFYAQSTEQEPVKQVFPYVKVYTSNILRS
jgi:hypothetical protein